MPPAPRRSCCGRGNRPAASTGFCASLKFSSTVRMVEDNGSFSIQIRTPNGVMPLDDALTSFKCGPGTAGSKLADIVNKTLSAASSRGRHASLQNYVGKTLPLIMLRDALSKIAGQCAACRGRGCNTCNGLGFV